MIASPRTPRILAAPGAPALIASSIVARLPLAMFSIALLVNAQRLTGSFAVAGAVSAAYALASAASAPLLGGVVDRHGQTRVLVGGATVTALALLLAGLLPHGAPPLLLIALAAVSGAATPPLDACVRTLLPQLAPDPDSLRTLFAFESAVLEVTFVLGPPIALGVGELFSTGAALVFSGATMLAGTLVFAARPASRDWRPHPGASRQRGGSLRSPAIRTLILILAGAGAAFGATEVGVTAAAHALGQTAAAGPLLGLWGAGSLMGGIVATRLGGGARGPRGVAILLTALAVTHGALILATGSVLALGALITLAGATIAPTVASLYALVDSVTPPGTQTEAFSWLLTADLAGAAVGALAGGVLAQQAGATAAFAFVGAAGGLAVLVAVTRSDDLGQSPAPSGSPAGPRRGSSRSGPSRTAPSSASTRSSDPAPA
jgi:predicted MFS family arabinose efflux permease